MRESGLPATGSLRRPFRFGVQLSVPDSKSAWLGKAQRAEELGYSTVTMPDHISEQLAPMPALMAIAASTESIRIGTMVMSNDWRNPILLAREAASLDWLSNGRFELGIGAGWQARDYERLGVQYDPPNVRVDRLAEALEIIRDLLSGATVTHSGQHYHFIEASCYPAPVQSPHLPLVVGGGSRRILTLAGRLADIVNLHTNLGASQRDERIKPDLGADSARKRLKWVREGAAERISEVEIGLRIFMAAVTDRRTSAAQELGSRWELSPSEVEQSPYSLVGSVDSIVDALIERRQQFGASYYLWNDSVLESMGPVVRRLTGS